MAMINTMALLDKESDGRRFMEFKAALRQSFPRNYEMQCFGSASF